MSCYYGSRISGFKQSFLTETATCSVKQWKKSMGYHFVPQWISCTGNSYLSLFHFFSAIVCQDQDILLPWQHDVTTSILYTHIVIKKTL